MHTHASASNYKSLSLQIKQHSRLSAYLPAQHCGQVRLAAQVCLYQEQLFPKLEVAPTGANQVHLAQQSRTLVSSSSSSYAYFQILWVRAFVQLLHPTYIRMSTTKHVHAATVLHGHTCTVAYIYSEFTRCCIPCFHPRSFVQVVKQSTHQAQLPG